MAAKTLSQKILDLLASGRPDVRCAAAVVLGAAGQGDKTAIAALADQLDTDSAMVRRFVLDALIQLEAKGLAGKLTPLLAASDDDTRTRALALLSAQGGGADGALGKALAAGTPAARKQAAQLLVQRPGAAALDALLAQVGDREVGEHVLAQLRAHVIDADDEARRKLLGERVGAELKRVGGSKKLDAEREARVSILLRLTGYLADPKSLGTLLAHAGDKWPTYVRLAAIAGLRRLVAGPAHKSTEGAIVQLLDWAADDDAQVARAAVDTLRGAVIPESAGKKLAALGKSAHPEARRLAAERLAQVAGRAGVPALLAQLAADDPAQRDTAQRSLASAPEAATPLANALAAARAVDDATRRTAMALRAHAGKLPNAAANALATAAAKAQAGKDADLARLLAETLAHVAPQAGAELAFDRARAQLKKGQVDAAWAEIKPLAQGRVALEDAARAFLVGVGLRAEGQRLLRAAASVDPTLGQAALLARQGAPLAKLLGKDKGVGPDELFVLGWNFVESGDDDLVESGRELLELVIQRSPRGKLGVAAKNKLKLIRD